MRRNRYRSFERGNGKKFEDGKMRLTELAKIGNQNGEPDQISGQQELYENIINQFI